ncbi:T9SS type A sorting domain-containing protein [Flexithrix dorotheae]|uniref:T9SS type A sorting domain-containing protein n=1 Tax=Flexithrix dorotheae TaxID=70993 RepID=UPI0003684680|nr:T9SS type A sorting domain-containing protein [Flexithrix dorotheae]
MIKPLFFSIILIGFSLLNALGQKMITNLNHSSSDLNSWPNSFGSFNNYLFFVAEHSRYGREIWVSNGTGDSTFLLKDINPGTGSGIWSFNSQSTIMGNKLYFTAYNEEEGTQIWSTDGTPIGTEKLVHFHDKAIFGLTTINDKFYFLLKQNANLEVWWSDGTGAGTQLIKGNISIQNNPTYQGKAGNTFIFVFEQPQTKNTNVWRSDGSVEGTYSILSGIDGNGAGPGGTNGLTQFVELNEELYFVIRSSSIFSYPKSVGIIKTDGTREGTKPVEAVHEGSTRLIDLADAKKVGNKLYFSFYEFDYNRLFIWEHDGSTDATIKIFDYSGSSYFTPSNLMNHGEELLFTCGTPENTTALFTYNTLSEELKNVENIPQPTDEISWFIDNVDAAEIIGVEKEFLITLPSRRGLNKIVRTDLSSFNTYTVPELAGIRTTFPLNDNVFFQKAFGNWGMELGKYNLITGLESVKNINEVKKGISLENQIKIEDKILYSGTIDSIQSFGLFSFDGNLNVVKPNSYKITGQHDFFTFQDKIYFSGYNEVIGYELFQTDGNTFSLVEDIIEGRNWSGPHLFQEFKETLYFIVRKDKERYLAKLEDDKVEMIKSFGTNSYNIGFSPEEVISSDNSMYFMVSAAGEDIWISDGTAEGTLKIKDFYKCEGLSLLNQNICYLAYGQGDDFFRFYNIDKNGVEETFNLEIPKSSLVENFIQFNNELFFTEFSKTNRYTLWKSDGTKEGTTPIKKLYEKKLASTRSFGFTVFKDKLFFSALNPGNGIELWYSDGTSQGTSLFKDLNPGGSSYPKYFTVLNDKMYFQAFTSTSGEELWETDGTPENTKMIFDLQEGPEGSLPQNFFTFNNEIYFWANVHSTGNQLWSLANDEVLSISDSRQPNPVTIFPNPTTDFISVSHDSKLEIPEDFEILNIEGKSFSVNLIDGKVHLKSLPSGIYILKFKIKGKLYSRRIVKK